MPASSQVTEVCYPFSMRRREGLVTLLISFAAAGCGDLVLPTAPPPPDPLDPSATFTRVQTEVFTPNCTAIGCHDAFVRQSDLTLVAGEAYGQIVNRPSIQSASLDRVEPGDPQRSYLYRKIIGEGIIGDRMPAGSPQLPEASIALVREWIRRGAPND
ncbi:MAG TPA: hypothetical protein VM557_09570 [Thermoanaerobaculia bacterium]|nr:hypothetical protein [Thermoanaerobaculia bacterium]